MGSYSWKMVAAAAVGARMSWGEDGSAPGIQRGGIGGLTLAP